MKNRTRQSNLGLHSSRYPSNLSFPSKTNLNPSSPTQFLHSGLQSDGLPRASSSKTSLHSTTHALNNPFVDLHPIKPSNKSTTVTSPRWDPIGDDDEIYVQSDDTHLRGLPPGSHRSFIHHRNSRLDQCLVQLKKRKRSPQPSIHDQTLRSSRPCSSSNSSRAPLKYDDEGCSNCRTKQSTCWWKKNRSIVLSDGTEAWGEEKLCNPCSIHWNKNGFHRHVRAKAPKEIAQQRLINIPKRSSSSRPRRSCSSNFVAGPSSPTASRKKAHPDLTRRARHSRSPSQLTLALGQEGREARIVQRSLAQASAKSEALRQKRRFVQTGFISEEEEPFGDPLASPPAAPPRTLKHSTRKSCRNTNQTNNIPSPRSFLFDAPPDHASPDLHSNSNSAKHPNTQYPVDPSLASFSNQLSTIDFFPHMEPLMENASISPPRTPPPNNQIGTGKQISRVEHSPGQLIGLDNILSPSFLNASPNSLLRRLNSQKPVAGNLANTSNLSSTCLSNFPSGVPEKVFSPNRHSASNSPSNHIPPTIEPSKKTDLPPQHRLIGSSGLLDAHMNSGSSNRSRNSIFSPPRPTPKSKESGSRKSKSKSATIPPESPRPVFGSSRGRRNKKCLLDEFMNGTKISMDRRSSHVEPSSYGKRTSDSSRKQPPVQSVIRSQSNKKNHMARSIWSRRFESTGISSEDSRLEEMVTNRSGHRLPSESHYSEINLTSAPMERALVPTGLSSAVFKSLNRSFSTDGRLSNRFGSGLGYSDGNMVSASSPPVLPPPSDCSEGITPHSAEPASDDKEKEPIKPSGMHKRTTGSTMLSTFLSQPRAQNAIPADYDLAFDSLDGHKPLSDITPSLNYPIRQDPVHSKITSTQNQSQHNVNSNNNNNNGDLSSDMMAALSEALKAGLSADELVRALKDLDSSGRNATNISVDDTTNQDLSSRNHNNNLMNQLIVNDSLLEQPTRIEHDLLQDSFDPNQFFLGHDSIPPVINSTSFDLDFDRRHNVDHLSLFSDNLNIDPNLVGDIEAILNQYPNSL